jgi:hypothetical protein
MTDGDDPLAPPDGYAHDPELDKSLADTQCDVREQQYLIPGISTRCDKDGILRIWFGCPKEHVGFADVCSRHRFAVLAGFPAKCDRCERGGQPSRSVIIKREELTRKGT